MIDHRLSSLRTRMRTWIGLSACWFCFSAFAVPSKAAAQQAPQQTQQQSTPQSAQPPSAPQKPAPQQPGPFENVPSTPEKSTAPAPAPNPNGIQEAKPAAIGANIIEAVEFRGERRTPASLLRGLIYTKQGDVYDEESIHRDFSALWNTGRFDDLRIEKEKGPNGGIILRFVVTERRIVHTIDYTGAKSISKSEILDRFKDRKLALSPESQFDPGKVQRGKNILQEFESERGHQYATVTPQIRQVPPGGVDITYVIDEGPKVKVGNIDIEGNNVFSDRAIIRVMKNLKPIGIPHSILFENLFARTYDATKLDEDSDRIRQYYQQHGYFMARVINHSEHVYDYQGTGIKLPLIKPNRPGKRVDVTMTVNEGDLYRLRNFNFVGMKLFRTPELIQKQVFGMTAGDVFSTEKLQKGIDNLKKLYGDFGYIDFVPSPDPEPVPGKDQIDLTIDVDEGHQFFVRRIDFQGNTTTRDRVIRRELMIDEGDLYSNRLWETSILRLNQLGFFEPLKPEDAATVTRDTKTNTVDLLVKLKERGKNSIQLNGGVSGISGSFIGASYATNNFLGLGETLSLSSQIGTLMSSVSFGFTEPYFMDKPIQTGFTVYYQRYRYDEGKQESLLYGTDLTSYFSQLPQESLLNYTMNGYGFTTFASYQLKRSFARLGLSYSYAINDIQPLTQGAKDYFGALQFETVAGPSINNLNAVKSSTITPTFSYNTVNHPIVPTKGLRISATLGFTGSFLGGNVNMIQPGVDVAYFRRGLFRGNVMGFHLNARTIFGYGGKVPPPYSRYYMGGENDVRGYDILTVGPWAYIPAQGQAPALDASGNQLTDVNGNPLSRSYPANIPIFPGGDTYSVFNYEYRIPIVGPVTLAPFFDAGMDRLLFPSQLKLNPSSIALLQQAYPLATFNSDRAQIIPGTQKIRMSTGVELQVMMPVVNAPFRLYWAYNLGRVDELYNIPNVQGYENYASPDEVAAAVAAGMTTNQLYLRERHTNFRFSVGRTF